MDLGLDKARLVQYRALAEKHLNDPARLRLFTAGVLLALVFFLIYTPLSKKIEQNKRFLMEAKERNNCIINYEKLQKQAMIFRPLIMAKQDTNVWISYLLDGMRKFQVKLHGMDSKPASNVGPYQTATLSMTIEGSYNELKKYVEWLESSNNLLRIDTLQFIKEERSLVMKIVILGIVPKK